MSYSEDQVRELSDKYHQVSNDLDKLMMKIVVAGQGEQNVNVEEHLLHGVSRRISVIKKSAQNIFIKFPLDSKRPLSKEDLYDVQINMHAYMINLYGVFDNFAWAFVHKHNLLENVGGKHGVGLFRKGTQKHLPKEIVSYLVDNDLEGWHDNYLKSFRDALAHRIPLYIPPSMFNPEEGERFQELESKKIGLIQAMKFDEFEELKREQEALGQPCFYFLHSFKGEKPKPILLHPQLLCDGLAISEFGDLYMEHWLNVA